MEWDELAPTIRGRKVEVIQRDGSRIRGRIERVEPDFLIVSKQGSIARPAVHSIRFARHERRGGRIRGIGQPVLLLGLIAAFGRSPRPAGAAAMIGGGYAMGRASDHEDVTILIVKSNPQPPPAPPRERKLLYRGPAADSPW